MNTRREFLQTAINLLAGAGAMLGSLAWPVRWTLAASRKIVLHRGTKRESLINRDPKSLDARNLKITPLKDFGTMGVADFEVEVERWRLEVAGRVETPLQLTYSEILSLPSIERSVLLICPGFFANYGRWRGVSMKGLLQKAAMESGVTHIIFSGGAKNSYERKFPVADVVSNRVFLAYRVNGKTLPIKHGFPLRIVAEGYNGSDWIKYVSRMSVERASTVNLTR